MTYSGRCQAFQQNIKLGYFDFGFGSKALLVSGHARRRTKLHVPIAMNAQAEFFAAVIAAQTQNRAQTASGRRARSIGAHYKSPGERQIMLHLRAEICQSCASVKARNVWSVA